MKPIYMVFSLLFAVFILHGCETRAVPPTEHIEGEQKNPVIEAITLDKIDVKQVGFTDVDGARLRGIEYQSYVSIPARLVSARTIQDLTVRLETTGKTRDILGIVEMKSPLRLHTRRADKNIYLVRFASTYATHYTDEEVEYVANPQNDVHFFLYVQEKKAKQLTLSLDAS